MFSPFTLYVTGTIIIFVAILFLFLLWLFNCRVSNSSISPPITDEFPTMHADCHKDTSCGGDLTCDHICHRCKKQLGGDCSGDVDCQTGLYCYNWKCTNVPNNLFFTTEKDLYNTNPDSKLKVHWDDLSS